MRRPQPLALAAAASAAALTLLAGAPAHAATSPPPGTIGATPVTGVTEAPRPAFYEPPATIPATPGAVIRSEVATTVVDPFGLSRTVVDARRVMYASTDRTGRPIAVTGVVIVPRAQWVGLGSRPVISYAPGTQGMADRCAPSRVLKDTFAEYETLFFSSLIARGYAVAITDYQGLGTPGSHTYMNREVQGRAVIDMARAAGRLGSGLTPSSPVGFMGYSQGGGAAASAAELASTYGAGLPVRGTVAGAVPADLAAVGRNLDNGLYAAFLTYAFVGLAAGYDEPVEPYVNPAGPAAMQRSEDSCVADGLISFAFARSSTYTRDGRPLTAYFDEEPYRSILADNRIGNRKPSAPVLLSHSLLDDVIPYAVGRQLGRDWCARGATVRFSTNALPTHAGGMPASATEALGFFEARFAGFPALSTCGLF